MFEFLSFVLVQFIFHCDYQAIDEGETVRIDGLQNKQVWPGQSRTSGFYSQSFRACPKASFVSTHVVRPVSHECVHRE